MGIPENRLLVRGLPVMNTRSLLRAKSAGLRRGGEVMAEARGASALRRPRRPSPMRRTQSGSDEQPEQERCRRRGLGGRSEDGAGGGGRDHLGRGRVLRPLPDLEGVEGWLVEVSAFALMADFRWGIWNGRGSGWGVPGFVILPRDLFTT